MRQKSAWSPGYLFKPPLTWLFTSSRKHAVLFIDENEFRFVAASLCVIQIDETGDYDQILRSHHSRCRAVDADHPGTSFPLYGICLEAVAVGHVPDGNSLIGNDIGGLHQV